jgi:anaerobic selenocysteine-containing dehydrogenase
VPEVLRTASGRIELAPERSWPTSGACTTRWPSRVDGAMVLVGRRDLRSNNSWMHNLPMLVSGKQRCTAHVHPADAERLGLVDGEPAVVRSRAGDGPASPSR